jgi:F1F0 ATPase subunit 2
VGKFTGLVVPAMTDVAPVLLAFALGMILGTVFFGGLWWTVARGTGSRHAAAWFLLSLLLRTAAAMLGFYLIGHGSWEKLAACVVGFALARLLVIRLTADAALPPQSAGRSSHAP